MCRWKDLKLTYPDLPFPVLQLLVSFGSWWGGFRIGGLGRGPGFRFEYLVDGLLAGRFAGKLGGFKVHHLKENVSRGSQLAGVKCCLYRSMFLL